MSSARLPGKVMAPILGEPMIAKHLERVRRAGTLTKTVVATSTDCSDEPLAGYLAAKGQAPFRGSLRDVLGRVAGAARAAGEPTHVVLLSADSPLIDPELIDEAVRLALASRAAYVGNLEPRTYPAGLEVEVLTAEALFAADAEATDPAEREDPALFVRRRPERFACEALSQPVDRSSLRWGVDGPAEFAFARGVYEALYASNRAFSTRDVLDLMCEAASPAAKDGLARAA